ncbi:hypothetical protein WMF11_29855 [Sorangium sp. So ce295]|uniref:hypothetical protein n=1 Tax=Sorangium sp. So ce295 TaxID=3133295 RepID=UPI003F5DBE80
MRDPDRPSFARAAGRLLTFRLSPDDLARLDGRHLALGLACTWLVGVGRFWDDPVASAWRKTGLGSVVYAIVLSAFLWVVVAPLRRPGELRLSYVKLLTVITMTAPPAALYAIPVERFTSMPVAIQINLGFLSVVAGWRVALLVHTLRRGVGLRWPAVITATLLPLALIVTGLTYFNLATGVIEIMGGLRDRAKSPDDGVNGVLLALALLSHLAVSPLLVVYGVLVVKARWWRGGAGRRNR